MPEIQAQAARAGAGATRAEEALDRCWAIARKDARGPVIRVSDGSHLLFAEDDGTRAMVAEDFKQAQAGGPRPTSRWTSSELSVRWLQGLGQAPKDGQA